MAGLWGLVLRVSARASASFFEFEQLDDSAGDVRFLTLAGIVPPDPGQFLASFWQIVVATEDDPYVPLSASGRTHGAPSHTSRSSSTWTFTAIPEALAGKPWRFLGAREALLRGTQSQRSNHLGRAGGESGAVQAVGDGP